MLKRYSQIAMRPAVEGLESRRLLSTTFYVSPSGSDLSAGTSPASAWRHIQKAFDAATAGSTVIVEAGRYNEKLQLHVSGNSSAGYITYQASGHVIIDGTGRAGANLVNLSNHNYVNFIGFELINDLKVSDGSGIRIEGTGNHLIIQHNTIHHITGADAMGITIYGESATNAISNLTIDSNEIYDCQPAHSETLTLNGNVTNFSVTNNYVHDVNNIGIDFIGGEGTSPSPSTDFTRNGICSGNRVVRCRSNYGGGYAGGIYVDGGQNIVIADNFVTQCDLGIEVGAENRGRVASGIAVRDNVVYRNDKGGIVFGGYDQSVGRVSNCQFLNNTLYQNDTLGTGNGEIWVQFASNCLIENNIICSTAQDLMINAEAGSVNNKSDYNLFFSPDGADAANFFWNGIERDGLLVYVDHSAQDRHSLFANPKFRNATANDFHLLATSPAINAGLPGFKAAVGEVDIDGQPRVLGARVDLGADEVR